HGEMVLFCKLHHLLRIPALLQEQASARLQRAAHAVEIPEGVPNRDGKMDNVRWLYGLSDDRGIHRGNCRVVDVEDAFGFPGRTGSDRDLQWVEIPAAGYRRSRIDVQISTPTLECVFRVPLRGACKNDAWGTFRQRRTR